MNEIEAFLDKRMPENVKYKLRQRGEFAVVDVYLRQAAQFPHWITAEFRRAFGTMGDPQLEAFTLIHEPDELVRIASMALCAWDRMVRLKAAAARLEQAG